MRKIKPEKIFFILILFFTLTVFSLSLTSETNDESISPGSFWDSALLDLSDPLVPSDPWQLALYITEQMSDEQALAQTMMFGWLGAEPHPLTLNWIRQRGIGGVKVFGWNTVNTGMLAETIAVFQATALDSGLGIPLLVATDQEGGLVRHVRGNTSVTPGNMAIGASGRPIDAYWTGYYIGRELALLGINMNFAPTVDLFNNRESSLIGTRAFGADPVMAGVLGAAFAKGQRDTGIIATAKHFPGHGDTALDSHGVLPIINASMETLWDRELLPYRFLISEGIPAVMSGHLAFPNTPGGNSPASLSSWFLNDLLREEMGFTGLIVTDDLIMGGALNYARNLPLAVKRALEAGNDVIMLSQTPALNDAIWNLLITSMRDEPEFRERVRDACRRVLALKLEYFGSDNFVPIIPDPAQAGTNLPHPEAGTFFMNLAARSVTIIDEKNTFPLSPEEAGRVLLAGNYSEFFNAGRRAFPGAASYSLPSASNLGDLAFHARNADTVILCVSVRLGNAALQLLRNLNARLIVFSILDPGFLDEISWADGTVAVYSLTPESFTAGFSAILGRIPGEGTMPFVIDGNQPAPRNTVIRNIITRDQ